MFCTGKKIAYMGKSLKWESFRRLQDSHLTDSYCNSRYRNIPYTTATTLSSTPVYVEFAPTAYSAYSGNIVVSGGGVFTNIPVTGTGVFACSGTPSISAATLTSAVSGGVTTYSMSVTPITSVGGITYQWQYWSFGTVGAANPLILSNIPGATNSTFTTGPQTQNSFYQCVVTCTNSGQSATSNVVEIFGTSSVGCTGTPPLGSSSVYAPTSSGCTPGYTTNVYLETSSLTDPSYAYQWEVSTTGPTSGFAPVSGASNAYYTPTVTSTVWVRDSITCGTSHIGVNTPAIQLAVNALPSAITGTTNICTGTPTTFGSSPSGGVFTSSGAATLSIGSSSGIATGIAPGSASITYTLPTGCLATTTAAVNLGAAPITGFPAVCQGSSVTLADLTAGGTWSSSNTAVAATGTSAGAITGVAAGTATITYTLGDACAAMFPLTVNPVPAAITGTANACIGLTSLLSDATPGGTWSSSNVFQATVGSASGIVNGIAAGTPSIYYTLSTGCAATLAFTVNALPNAISGTRSVCVGATTNLTDFIFGGSGTWSSGNASIASIGGTGTVTGVAAGTAVITFTRTSTGCYSIATVTVNPLPVIANVTEPMGGGFCPGGTGVHIGLDASYDGVNYYLYDSSSRVDSLPGATSALDFGLFNSVGTYTVRGTNAITGCSVSMAGSATVYNYPLPTADSVLGGGSFCAGTTGVNVYMASSDLGVTYQLYIDGMASGTPVAGTGSYLSFGTQTAPGYYTATALNITTLCTSTMPGGASVYVLPAPVVDTISAGGSYCLGGTGVDVSLSNSTLGIFYMLYHNGAIVTTSLSVGGGPIDYGNQTGAGKYTVVALNNANHCTSNMADTARISIDSLPAVYATTGGGAYCSGSGGKHIGLAYSVIGTNYSLYNSGSLVNTVAGSNSGLDFGAQTAPGVYSVVGKFAATGCLDTMTGTKTISVDSLPTAYNVSGTAGYCAGGAGVPVTLAGSESGRNFKYRLYLAGSIVGTQINGTGSSLNFGLQTAPGTYKVVVLDTITTCMRTMNDSAIVTVNPLPFAYTVSGTGNYCSGGTGLPVMLSGSQAGISYHLMNSGATITTSTGTGSALSFAHVTLPGTYTVMAVNTVTGCTMALSGSAIIGTLPLPVPYLVSGGGTECAGGPGFPVNLAVSSPGISYQLFNSGFVGAPLLGTGTALSFGTHATAGNYRVIATDLATSCSDTMAGSAPVIVNALPGRYTVTGGGAFCAGTAGAPVGLSGSDSTGGVTYHLYNGTTAISSLSGTGHSLNFGLENVTGTYMVVATSTAGCSDTMSSGVIITANPAPTVYNVGGGGSFCAGDTGVHIFLSGSHTYVNYQVYRGGSIPVGMFWAGTGRTLDLGLDSVAGTYTVVATDVLTGCSSNMADSAVLVVNPSVAPSVTISTGRGDTVCAGSPVTFAPVPVNGGTAPMYQWAVNGVTVSVGGTYELYPYEWRYSDGNPYQRCDVRFPGYGGQLHGNNRER